MEFRNAFGAYHALEKEDLALLLATSSLMNQEYSTANKIIAGLNGLRRFSIFRDYIFEFYLKVNGVFRCVALSGVEIDVYNQFIQRRIRPNSRLNLFFKKKKRVYDNSPDEETEEHRKLFIEIYNIKSYLVYPTDSFGYLVINRRDKGSFKPYEYKLLDIFVKYHLNPSVTLAYDNEKNLDAALKDPLTGLFNRGFFNQTLELKAKEQEREDLRGISLVMVDIDNFKRFNDTYGHQEGDRILISVAKILVGALRNTDFVARYGGEEFVIVMPDTAIINAKAKIEMLRRQIEETSFKGKKVTVSLGLASFPESVKDHKDLVSAADKALYYSKANGRNQLTVYNKRLM